MQLWRVVEHQAAVSTRALTDTIDEQERLEQLLDSTKPPKAANTPADLHYLLHTPFRYYPADGNARFSSTRSRSHFYGAEHIDTALAECTFHRFLFFHDSDAFDDDFVTNLDHTVFRVTTQSWRGVDLTTAPFTDYPDLSDPMHYASCQTLADAMQEAGVTAARYTSVRDPQHRPCGVLFSPLVFIDQEPIEYRTWHARLSRTHAEWTQITPTPQRALFQFDDFCIDGQLPRPYTLRTTAE